MSVGLLQEYRRSVDGCAVRPAKVAVNGISLTIPYAECFGLLGVNGMYIHSDYLSMSRLECSA